MRGFSFNVSVFLFALEKVTIFLKNKIGKDVNEIEKATISNVVFR